jgi:TrmH family RNA methyltransferase
VLVEQITSRQNPLVKRMQRVRDGAEPGLLFAEGPKLVEEAVASGVALDAILYTPAFADTDHGRELLRQVAMTRCRGAVVPNAVMRAVADVETPQGVVAIAARPRFEVDDTLSDRALAVLLDGVQDPGNVGAIVRAAEAAGASGVLTTPGTAEPYGPKALRSSMGSAFRIPIARRATPAVIARAAEARGVRLLAASSGSGTPYTEVDWTRPTILMIGNEGAGLSLAARERASEVVTVPLAEPVESLNAAVAAGIMLFEAVRQRSASAPRPRAGSHVPRS